MRNRRSAAGLLGAAAALALVVGGCSLEPRYQAPPLPVPDAWPIPPTTAAPTTLAPTTAALAAADVGWRDFFADARLQQVIALALGGNRDLRVAVLNVEQARSQYRIQSAQRLPALSATGSYERESLPPALTFGINSPLIQYYDVSAAITNFEVDLFGRVHSLSRAAFEQYLSQSEARRSAQLGLIAGVAQAWLSLASDRSLETLAEQTLASEQQSFERTQAQHERGAVSGLDLAQAQTTVESARVDVAHYQGSVAQDIDALTLLVGAPVDPALLPTGLEEPGYGLHALPGGLPSTVLLRRPDVIQAEHALRAANANIGAARASFLPTIDLTASIGTASPALSGLFRSGSREWTFSPQVSVPIFQGGKLLAELASAHAAHDIALAQYEKSIQSAFREVADALALEATITRQRDAGQALVVASERAYRLSEQRYHAGRDSYLTLLESQRSYYSAQRSLISTQLALQTNRVQLYRALGGGWRERGTGTGG